MAPTMRSLPAIMSRGKEHEIGDPRKAACPCRRPEELPAPHASTAHAPHTRGGHVADPPEGPVAGAEENRLKLPETHV